MAHALMKKRTPSFEQNQPTQPWFSSQKVIKTACIWFHMSSRASFVPFEQILQKYQRCRTCRKMQVSS